MNLKTLLITLVTILSGGLLSAKSVDINTAEKVAKNFYFQQENIYKSPVEFNNITISNRYTETRNGVDLIYVFEIENGGIVIISAEDAMTPVIGYIPNKNEKWDLENANPEFKYFLGSYEDIIETMISSKYQQEDKVANDWQKYCTDNPISLLTAKERIEVGPYLKTTWNQDYPYNYYAPAANGGSGGRCYAGCVATAMSVLMEYWRWPLHGSSSTAYYSNYGGILRANFDTTYYNYDAMLTSISSSSNEDAILSIALLQYHAGVAVQMGYGPNGSGAFSTTALYALKHFFRYNNNADLIDHDNYTQDTWNNTVINELSAKHVLYYGGCSNDGCHAWNCDGYRNTDGTIFFHQNFNWGGSSNGWYVASVPGSFPNSQQIMTNMIPDTTENTYPYYASGLKTVTNKVGRVMDGSGPVANYIPTDAAWLINPANHSGDSIINITISWESFNLAQGDYVKIYDGNNSSASLLGEYTGSTLPGSVTSTGKNIYITFNATNSAAGFTFTYTTTRPVYCSGQITTHENPLVISSSPEGKFYEPNSLCRYIVSYPNHNVKISFDFIDTYDKNDYIQIVDASNNLEYGPFFGNEKPDDIVTTGNAYIVFKSDNFNSNNYGFSLTCSAFDGIETCDAPLSDISIYPNPTSKSIQLTFNSNILQNVDCKIFDLQGKEVYKTSFINTDGTISKSIDVSFLKSGIYFVKLINQNGTLTEKLIIE